MSSLFLREVVADDLPVFFEQQLDAAAHHMVAFTRRDPTDREGFDKHWERILPNPTGMIRTIVYEEQVAGYILSFEMDGKIEVGYWLGKAYWGKGIATRAVEVFLEKVNTMRPIYAQVAKDNAGSFRVLEKCGFRVIGEGKDFAYARGEEIEEWILERRD